MHKRCMITTETHLRLVRGVRSFRQGAWLVHVGHLVPRLALLPLLTMCLVQVLGLWEGVVGEVSHLCFNQEGPLDGRLNNRSNTLTALQISTTQTHTSSSPSAFSAPRVSLAMDWSKFCAADRQHVCMFVCFDCDLCGLQALTQQ